MIGSGGAGAPPQAPGRSAEALHAAATALREQGQDAEAAQFRKTLTDLDAAGTTFHEVADGWL